MNFLIIKNIHYTEIDKDIYVETSMLSWYYRLFDHMHNNEAIYDLLMATQILFFK